MSYTFLRRRFNVCIVPLQLGTPDTSHSSDQQSLYRDKHNFHKASGQASVTEEAPKDWALPTCHVPDRPLKGDEQI